MHQTFINAAEVAKLIGLPNGPAFLRRRVSLETLHGFPQPMPYGAQTLIWRRNQIMSWLQETGLPMQQIPAKTKPNLTLLKAAQTP